MIAVTAVPKLQRHHFFNFHLYLTASLTTTVPTLSGKRILLLIAHPDDEAMFLAQTGRSMDRLFHALLRRDRRFDLRERGSDRAREKT